MTRCVSLRGGRIALSGCHGSRPRDPCASRVGPAHGSRGRDPRHPMTRHPGAMALLLWGLAATLSAGPASAGDGETRVYENRLTPIADPKPILADHPRFVEPIRETARFEAPVLVDDPGADLDV